MAGENGYFWLVLSLLFWVGYCVSLYWMAYQVARHTQKISFPFFSFFKTPEILESYKKWSEESGRTALAYYCFYASAVMLIAAAVMGLISLSS
ncbi:MAG: hypothetical protein ACLFQR_08720 [Desulfovibrionales bacterium]